MRADGCGEVGELPVHKFKESGDTIVKPCPTEWAAQIMLGKGLMPVLSTKGRDAVRLEVLQSVAVTAFPFR
jgi:predicted component of type VI protein secretion system